jgi:hypothetical protein
MYLFQDQMNYLIWFDFTLILVAYCLLLVACCLLLVVSFCLSMMKIKTKETLFLIAVKVGIVGPVVQVLQPLLRARELICGVEGEWLMTQ